MWSTREEPQTPALPLDLYRCLIGLTAFFYFAWLQSEWQLYTAPDGFLDHDEVRRIFWFTQIGLYQPWMGDALRHGLFYSAWAATLGVLVGWRPRLCALWSWMVGSSHLRWNFPLANLNDTTMLFPLLWCALLPVGRTLTLKTWQQRSEWGRVLVPGGVARLFVWNMALSYWVTGLSKIFTLYWQQGIAVFVSLQLNISRTRGWWSPEPLWVWQAACWGTVLLECLLPLTLFLRPGNRLRILGFLTAFSLHFGIMTMIGVELANWLFILAWLVALREDLAIWWGWARSSVGVAMRNTTRYATLVFFCIALSMSEGVPGLGQAYGLGFALQWSLGLCQEYHLFDWIDRFNTVIEPNATLDGASVPLPFPQGLRGFLLQSYLFDMRWMRLPRGQVGEWQRSLRHRVALQAARQHPDGHLEVRTWVTRITPDNLDGHRKSEVVTLDCTFQQGRIVSER